MYFKKLELVGFKSFCDKTTLHFEPGITAVVGPNGCGKSNIFDSIRWVLGEQSAKSLRGSEMQDVIFNGTDQKEPLGMAEVTLTFDNANRFFNYDAEEIAITRRLFRSGESEYCLNKSQVRLKDILDILLGTGVGAESYSIVAQGKIDLVLSSRPEDRRLVFDEASGITKYKSQKRETQRRLEETEQNLLRVNDIVVEVKRQIGSLERQANKARRYKEVFEELKSKEINLAILDKQEILKQKNEIIAQLNQLEAREQELLSLVKTQEESIAGHQQEMKELEDGLMSVKNEILNIENQVVRNNEHIVFNKERLAELEANQKFFDEQAAQVRIKLAQDEESLNNVKTEYDKIRQNIDSRSLILIEKETGISELAAAIKLSLDNIAGAKKGILDLVTRIAACKNEAAAFSSQEQVHQARKKRLEIEKAKVFEEKVITEGALNEIIAQVNAVKSLVDELNAKISGIKGDIDAESLSLGEINGQIAELEKQSLTLESHREFLKNLKTKYENIGESMNAVIYLDKLPAENTSGLVIKVKDCLSLSDEDKAYLGPANYKISGEAKPIELGTEKIEEKINSIAQALSILKNSKGTKEARIQDLNSGIFGLQQELRNQEIALANKETSRLATLEQFNKIKEEEDITVLELQDVAREIEVLQNNIAASQAKLTDLNRALREVEDSIVREEDAISINSKLREEILVAITQIKTELESLNKRIATDEETVRLLQGTYDQDKETLGNIERQALESRSKKELLEKEIVECETKNHELNVDIDTHRVLLKVNEEKYREATVGTSDVMKKIEEDRKEMDEIKNQLYQLQMNNKDVDYRYSTIKERMLQSYKIDLDGAPDPIEALDANALSSSIEELKNKLDSYGSVNLVAIEEYDELKKRYDFLVQQQNDLLSAKESLHQAILKLNRTTKQMFMETFEKVREEFKNYFRLLFNGGDAQVYLIDENDPLESGIEIVCRPPGKKLQNVLLLSGGEKSMSAIALIFAIFKVKPAPFCILDEIDAALDEANVDRFSRILQEFSKTSQFIVVTHNKKTIANANVMYGITMQNSGVSKIVSVKFAENKQKEKDKEPETVGV